MFEKRSLLTLLLIAAAASTTASLECEAQTSAGGSESKPTFRDAAYTLQVSAFPSADLAAKFAEDLRRAGEQPICVRAEIQGRGIWTRVLTGAFDSLRAAREYGRALMARGLVREFLVRSRGEFNPRPESSDQTQTLLAGRSTVTPVSRTAASGLANGAAPAIWRYAVQAPITPSARQSTTDYLGTKFESSRVPFPLGFRDVEAFGASRETLDYAVAKSESSPARIPLVVQDFGASGAGQRTLKPGNRRPTSTASAINLNAISVADPFRAAFSLILGADPQKQGGLWLGGDFDTGLAVLRSIVGPENAGAIFVDGQGRVELGTLDLRIPSGILARQGFEGTLEARDYIYSNQGLLLLVQLTQGEFRYQLYVGERSYTRAGNTRVTSSLNLDCMFDSRINPRRPGRKKLNDELPPEGFDSSVAINPSARWINIQTARPVPLWIIAFHELAEAHSKVALGLDYLPRGPKSGAHQLAVEREVILSSQRRSADLVLTVGNNIVFKSDLEMAKYLARTVDSK
jgi:hypothetical protein